MANKGIFTGRIAKKEIRRNNEKAVANVSLAVSYYDRAAKEEKAFFVKTTVWDKAAENLEKLADVGDLVYMEGEWRPNNWTSKTNGEKHNELRLSVERWELLRKKGTQTASAATNKPMPDTATADSLPDGFYPMDETLEDDDLPF